MKIIRKMPSRLRLYGFVAGFYVVVAASFVIPALQRHKTEALVTHQLHQLQSQPQQAPAAPVTGHPVSFAIERLGIELPVQPGTYNASSRAWTLDEHHVFVNALEQARPVISTSASAQPLVTVLYGHAVENILGKTNQLVPGDLLKITTDNGYVFTYDFISSQVVSPSDAHILSMPNSRPTVSLITCSGIWSQSRRIMYFAPAVPPTPVKAGAKV